MKEVKTGSKHNVKMASDEQQENTATGLNSLSKQEKEKVDHILFLLDIFCVGDSSYHELSMFNDLPKSYLIKQRQTQHGKHILFLCCSKFNEQNGQKLMGKK